MKRPALIWLTFLCFLALALGAMGWMTRTVLRLEQAQARAATAAQVEENVRLALWRMDYAMAPILGQETARPYFEYSPVFPAERAYTRMYQSGAHHVVDSIADLIPCLDDIDKRLACGERP